VLFTSLCPFIARDSVLFLESIEVLHSIWGDAATCLVCWTCFKRKLMQSIFALSIMPTSRLDHSSLMTHHLVLRHPGRASLGEEITQYTGYLTVLLCFLQESAFALAAASGPGLVIGGGGIGHHACNADNDSRYHLTMDRRADYRADREWHQLIIFAGIVVCVPNGNPQLYNRVVHRVRTVRTDRADGTILTA
jgi:hypothetical protein